MKTTQDYEAKRNMVHSVVERTPEAQEIFELTIGDVCYCADYEVTRVVGGWIYKTLEYNDVGISALTSIFVKASDLGLAI